MHMNYGNASVFLYLLEYLWKMIYGIHGIGTLMYRETLKKTSIETIFSLKSFFLKKYLSSFLKPSKTTCEIILYQALEGKTCIK